MPKISWEELNEFKHNLERIRTYHCEIICQQRILLNAIKEALETMDSFTEEAKDEPG